MRWLTIEPMDEAAAREYVQGIMVSAREQPRTVWDLAITVKGDDAFLGRVGMKRDADPRSAMLWFARDPAHQGNGYVTEAVRALLGHAFDDVKLHRVWGDCDPDAVHVNFPDKLKFRYKLLGSNAEWSSWNEERRINYSGIAPGSYCFMVQSTFDEIQVSNTEQVCFEISKPFWEENWFRTTVILLTLAFMIIIFKWRESIIKNKAQAKTLELTLKNELLTLEQKALQLQMNPHFIFNALNSIQSLVVNKDADAARKQIQNFAMLMRGILNNSRSKTVTIQSEVELLTKYLNMEQFCEKNKFTYSMKVAEDIHQEETEIPSMLIQPYIENAIIHGISHLSAPGHVEIVFELQGQLLTCTISDNGVGRKRANELSMLQKQGHTSVSMEVTEQRLDALMSESG